MSSLLAVVQRSGDTPMFVEDYLAREHARRRRRGPDRAAGAGGRAGAAGRSASRRRTCSSPRRIVTRSESRCSSSAWANLRDVPSSSRSWASVNAPPLPVARAAIARVADLGERVRVVVQRLRDPDRAAGGRAARRGRLRSSSESSGGSRPHLAAALERQRAGVRAGPELGPLAARRRRGPRRRHALGASPRASRSSRASSSRLGPCLRACGSSTTPPPSVSGGAIWRTTSRSPAAGISGCSSRICQKRPPSQASRAGLSRVPWWTWTRSPCSGSSIAGAQLRVEQVRRASSSVAGAAPAHLRATCSRDGDAGQVDRHPLAGLRALARLVVDLDAADAGLGVPRAAASARSPRPTDPDHSVPVTTVPAPRIVNTRSMCRRAGAAASAAAASTRRPRGRAPRAARRARLRCGRETGDDLGPGQQLGRLREHAPARGRRGRSW